MHVYLSHKLKQVKKVVIVLDLVFNQWPILVINQENYWYILISTLLWFLFKIKTHPHFYSSSAEPNMEKIFLCFASLVAIPQSQRTFNNRIINSVAPDSSILKKDGLNYMVLTRGNKIEILKSHSLSSFRNADRSIAYTGPPDNSNLCWSPELRFIRGRFYNYFAIILQWTMGFSTKIIECT